MKYLISAIATILVVVHQSAAADKAENPDIQARFPLHIQYLGLKTNSLGDFGIGIWNIFLDTTAKNNETRSFNLIGPLWQYDKKGSWFEILGGCIRNEDGYNDPIVDLRILDRTLPRINLTSEVGYFPRKERERFYTFLAADTPVQLGEYQVRVGFETENILSFAGKEDSLGIGPRLVLPIAPKLLKRVSPGLSSSCTIAYQCRNDVDFLRLYVGVTYKFGGK